MVERTPVGEHSLGLLAEVPVLAGLEPAMLQRVAALSSQVRLHANEALFAEGEAGHELFVVRSGRLEVRRGAEALGTVGRGAILGELAVLTGGRRSATVTAMRDSELLAVPDSAFTQLLADPAFALALTRAMAERLAGTIAPAETEGQHVGIVTVAATSEGLPVRELAKAFTTAVPSTWAVAVLDPPAEPRGTAAEWATTVEQAEARHDLVVLVAPEPCVARPVDQDPWTAFALRQADRALVLTAPDDPPAARPHPHWDVGVVQAAPALGGLPRWAHRCRAHHWLRPAELADDAARAARRITGTSLGLVLSGGGARGLAHIGVLAALGEAGVTIDRLGGTSVGAFVSALAATGRDPEELVELCRAEVVQRRPFADYTLPRHGLIRAQRAIAMMRRVFGELRAEQLPVPWFGVTCDLHSGNAVVHRRGPVRLIVGASMSLPGLAPPRWFLGQLLSDGGVVNNLPVDVMLDDGEGPVVAVDVMRQWSTAAAPATRPGARRPVPSIVDTLVAASQLSARQGALVNRQLARLLITPELGDVGLLDWRRLDGIVEEGRRAAEAALAGAGDLREAAPA